MLKKSSMLLAAAVCSISFIAGNVQAGDVEAGKSKAMACTGCHGPKGISFSPDIPNLAGQKESYLAKAIGYYKTGERKNPMMASMVGGLSETDMADLAAYFSSLK